VSGGASPLCSFGGSQNKLCKHQRSCNNPFLLTFPDEGHSQVEERFVNIGRASKGNVLVVVHTERKGSIRIISSRKATATERRVYEEEGG
jgi:uncharacterized DUF497 family protein